MGVDYSYMISAIRDYYGTTGTIWNKIELGTATYEDISFAFSRIPSRTLSIDRTPSGTTLGYGYADPVYMETYKNPILESIDSNFDEGEYSDTNAFTPKFNSTWGYDETTHSFYVKGGAKDSATGNSLSTITDRASLAVTGINIGAKLGKTIDEALYNIDPDWWDTHYPAINPSTWTGIAGKNNFGNWFIRTLFDIKDDGATAYVDEKLLAQTYQMLRDLGYMGAWPKTTGQTIHTNETITPSYVRGKFGDLASKYFGININPSDSIYDSDAVLCNTGHNTNNKGLLTRSTAHMNLPNSIIVDNNPVSNIYHGSSTIISDFYVYRPDYVNNRMTLYSWGSGTHYICNNMDASFNTTSYSTAIFVGNADFSITNIPNSTKYPPNNITGNDLDTVLNQLKTEYPDLFTDSIYEDVLQDDGSIKKITYVPVPWTSEVTDIKKKPQEQEQPKTTPNPEQSGKVDPQTMTDILKSPSVPSPTDTTPDVPTTGTGESPSIPPVVGSGASMWAIYNPTQAQVDSFGSWLWSSNFVDQLKKLFTDPMGAIIGIHKVFATPVTGNTSTIKCGYIDSGVSSKVVTNQYSVVECGTVALSEYYGSVFDYAPYTSVKCFLPFIGIVTLDVADVMRSKVNIRYKVDVLTGACIAEIRVKRDGNESVLYTFSGSCIVSYPISSGSYMGIVSSVVSIAGGIIAGGMSGGLPLVAGMMGAGASLMHSHTDTKINGSFTGSAGAMGGKKPYLIITRPITRIAQYANKFIGYGSNYYMKIGDCTGYFICDDVHLLIDNAYKTEIEEIEMLLKTGVMMQHELVNDEYYEPQDTTVLSLDVVTNGIYEPPIGYAGYNPVTVNVTPILQDILITENGVYSPESGYQGFFNVDVNITPAFSQEDDGKVVYNGQLTAQTARQNEITVNGTYDTTYNDSVTVNISGGYNANLDITKYGIYGGSQLNTATSISFTISNQMGKYALICITYRKTLTPPQDCVLLDSQTFSYGGFTQHTSVFKCYIDSASKSFTFTQASSDRIGATVWTIGNNFTLTYVNKYTYSNVYTASAFSLNSSDLTFFTFNAPTAQTNSSNREALQSNAWINQTPINEYQLRHASGIILPSPSQKTTTIKKVTASSSTASADAQICVYTIT